MNLWRPILFLALSIGALAPARAQHAIGPFLLPDNENLLPLTAKAGSADSTALDRLLAGYEVQVFGAGKDSRASTFLTLDPGAGLSLLCDSGFGMNSALIEVSQLCLLGALESEQWAGMMGATAVGFQQRMRLGDSETPFDVSFGLSWLHANDFDADATGMPMDLFDARFAPSAGLLPKLSGEQVTLEATQWLNQRSWLRVTGQAGRYRSERLLPDLGLQRWNRSALSLQAGYGAFAGSLTGHRNEYTGPLLRRAWFDVDLGLSWRTPWSGLFTVGARNLLNRADQATPGTAVDPATKVHESRTPYVRYQQDL